MYHLFLMECWMGVAWIVMIWGLGQKGISWEIHEFRWTFPQFQAVQIREKIDLSFTRKLRGGRTLKNPGFSFVMGREGCFLTPKIERTNWYQKNAIFFFSSPLFQTISVISFRGWTKLPMATLCLRCFFHPIRVSYGDKLVWSPFPASQGWFGECMWSPSLQLIILSHHTLKGAQDAISDCSKCI